MVKPFKYVRFGWLLINLSSRISFSPANFVTKRKKNEKNRRVGYVAGSAIRCSEVNFCMWGGWFWMASRRRGFRNPIVVQKTPDGGMAPSPYGRPRTPDCWRSRSWALELALSWMNLVLVPSLQPRFILICFNKLRALSQVSLWWVAYALVQHCSLELNEFLDDHCQP